MDPKALRNISYGLYVIASKNDERFNGQVANTVFQITAEPATIAISLNKQNLTHEFIQASQIFTVSVLAQDTPLSLIGHFGFKSGKNVEKFAGINYNLTSSGVPYLKDYTLAYLEAKVNKTVDVGTHTIFIATLTEAAVLAQGNPMTYTYYHQIKRGTTPKTAPTHKVSADGETANDAPKYKCTICNYVYDPTKGDAENGISPGTPFEALPDEWTCPICGAGKDAFEKI